MYFKVTRILSESSDLTQCELSKDLSLSLRSINYCLNAQMSKGLVKMKNFTNSRNRFDYINALTPSGLAEKATITHRFLQKKQREYEALKAEIEKLVADGYLKQVFVITEKSVGC